MPFKMIILSLLFMTASCASKNTSLTQKVRPKTEESRILVERLLIINIEMRLNIG